MSRAGRICAGFAMVAAIGFGLVVARAQQQGTSFPPVLVQATNVVTDAGGNWAVSWATTFASAVPFVSAKAIVSSGNNPITCEIASRTANSASGWCRQSTPALLNLSIINSGLTLNPFGNAPAVGTTVMVAARDATQ